MSAPASNSTFTGKSGLRLIRVGLAAAIPFLASFALAQSVSTASNGVVIEDPTILVDNRLGTVISRLDRVAVDPSKPITLVLADEFDLRDVNLDSSLFPPTVPHHLILVAKTIRLNGYLHAQVGRYRVVDNSLPYGVITNPPPALTLIANKIVLGKLARINVWGDPGDYPRPAFQRCCEAVPRLTVAAEEVDFAEKTDFWNDVISDPRVIAQINQYRGFAGLVSQILRASESPVAQWKKPLLQELAMRPPDKEIDEQDEEFFGRVVAAWIRNDPWGAFAFSICSPGPQDIRTPDGTDAFQFRVCSYAPVLQKLPDAVNSDPAALIALSRWMVERVKGYQLALSEAERRQDRAETIKVFRDYQGLSAYPIISDHRNAYLQALTEINSVRNNLEKQLWTRPITIEAEGIPPHDIDVFFEGTSLEGRPGPTTALLKPRMVNGKPLLGTLRYSNQQDIAVNFTADLTVDPLVASKLGEQLVSRGEHAGGMFSDWALSARQLTGQGIKSSQVTRVGDTLDIELTLDAEMGPIALWRLTGEVGLPLIFEYSYAHDDKQKGTLRPVLLSTARREEPSLTISDAVVRNIGSAVLSISYFQDSRGNFHILSPAQKLPQGKTLTLPQIPGTDPAKVRIPAEAVMILGQDPYSLDEFQNIGNVQLVDRITIKNLLPSFDSTRNTNLQFVEIALTYETDGTQGTGQPYGPFTLLATPVEASQKQIPFVRLKQGARHIHVEGKAIYENGVQNFSGDVTTPFVELRSDTPGQITVAGAFN